MSNQNTTISALPLNTPNASVEATIDSDKPGIKRMLLEFFTNAKLFAKISHADSGITTATIQGNPEHLSTSLEILKGLLHIYYKVEIEWTKESVVEDENRLTSVTIKDTPAELRLDLSSGDFQEKHFEEISFGASATTENLKKIAKETFFSMANAATGFGVANRWIPAVKEKHICVKYSDQTYDLEVSGIKSLEMLIQAVGKKLQIPQPIKLLYREYLKDIIVVTDVTDLRKGCLYYALTVNEELPKKQTARFSTMEEFFEKLTTEEDMSKVQVAIAKEKFETEGITFKQLMKTGELAITDAQLERIGIIQLGLRKAILAVIKSYV